MNKIVKVICGAFVMCMMITLFGCAKDIKNITDFSKFSNMTQETDKIEVTYDNGSGTPFCFTIENQSDIDEIMNIIFSSSFKNMGKGTNDGGHTTIVIIQGDDEYKMHVGSNKEGNNYYSFSTNDLQDKINELAREAGAYETVE